MKLGEIWKVSLDPATGREQFGFRPVMIVSPTQFNHITRLPIICPITNGGKFARAAGFTIELNGHGLKTTGFVRCDQPRVTDLLARQGQLFERAPAEIISSCLAILATLFG